MLQTIVFQNKISDTSESIEKSQANIPNCKSQSQTVQLWCTIKSIVKSTTIVEHTAYSNSKKSLCVCVGGLAHLMGDYTVFMQISIRKNIVLNIGGVTHYFEAMANWSCEQDLSEIKCFEHRLVVK